MPAGFDYETWLGPAPVKPYTADRCHPKGTYWIYDHSIGYLGGWGRHPLDILVWGCEADLAGPWTVEGTGKVPDTGLYDTVVRLGHEDHVRHRRDDDLQAGQGLDQVHRHRGLDPGLAKGWDAEPKSLLKEKPGPGTSISPSARTTTRTS